MSPDYVKDITNKTGVSIQNVLAQKYLQFTCMIPAKAGIH